MKNLLFFKLSLTFAIGIFIPLVSLFFVQDVNLLILIGIVCAISGTGILFISLKPLKNLLQSSDNLASGLFNQRVDIRSGDEFEKLGNSFNQMADKIQKIFQSIEKEKEVAISEKSKLDEVISSLMDGIIALDFNKNIILSNKAVEEITGYSSSELQGKPIDKLIHLFSDSDEIFAKTYCQLSFKKSVKLVGKDGKQTKISLTTGMMGGGIQTNLSCILVLRDLSKEEELERMKLDFISMASHELKTPLTSITGYLSVFLEENKGKIPKEEMDLIERSLIASQQLFTLVQNLLNVNKIEREQISVSIEPLDYQPILSKAVEDLRNQASQKNIILSLNIPPSLPKVMADPIRIGEVITNLVANAINYTNPGGKVDVSIEISPIQLTTIVSDTGVGIPKEAMSQLFTKFFRVSNQAQKAGKGTGLGLYISKSIIEKLNGKIWVESEDGKGSKFFFTLPIATLSTSSLDSNQFVSQEIQSGGLNY